MQYPVKCALQVLIFGRDDDVEINLKFHSHNMLSSYSFYTLFVQLIT